MTATKAGLLLDAGSYTLAETGVGGIGLRVAELAETLAGRFAVRVAVDDPSDAIATGDAQVVPRDDWARLLAESHAVFFFDLPDRARLEEAASARRVVVSENAAPIEQLEYPSLRADPDAAGKHAGMVAAYRRQLEVSHHFLARSHVERATLVANLCLAGRLTPADLGRSRTLDHLVSLVPIGFGAGALKAATTSEAAPAADFLWTGGLWAYFAPELLVEAVALCHGNGVPVTAEFLYARPEPDNAAILSGLRDRVAAEGLRDAVRFRAGPLRHRERDAVIKGARALVCVARPGVENQTCVRLRARDSRLYGVPAIVDPHGPTAEELRADGLAHVLPETTAERLADALATAARRPRRPVPGDLGARYRYDNTLEAFMTWLAVTLR
uniref:Putative glycosyltransferase n=1 Tax=Sphaerisporangium sp. SANK 60911 TaxID=1354075 RepID=V5YS24_9ACTN|nr:putative glycosyltransferase [Sphaerisporangium sp. SANK 60911]